MKRPDHLSNEAIEAVVKNHPSSKRVQILALLGYPEPVLGDHGWHRPGLRGVTYCQAHGAVSSGLHALRRLKRIVADRQGRWSIAKDRLDCPHCSGKGFVYVQETERRPSRQRPALKSAAS